MFVTTWTGVPGVLTKMPWLIQYLVILVPFAMSMVSVVDSGKKLPPIYWNSSNTLFDSDFSTIKIQMYDAIDLVCPYYPPGRNTDPGDYEYYSIYIVSKEEYEECRIFSYSAPHLVSLINCNNATAYRIFTILVVSYQAIPGLVDFSIGMKYYVITTSTGSKFGINNQWGGACKEKHMRLILDLTNDTDTSGTPPPSTRHTRPTNRTTIKSTTTSTQKSTTPKPTLPPTTQSPSTASTTSTIRLPDGTPGETNIIIDVTGGHKNTGTISSAWTLRPNCCSLCWTLILVTFMLLVR